MFVYPKPTLPSVYIANVKEEKKEKNFEWYRAKVCSLFVSTMYHSQMSNTILSFRFSCVKCKFMHAAHTGFLSVEEQK